MQVLLEVTSLLEKHQEALVTAAERQEQPKATFMGDGKSLKSLGILHLTEVLAQHAGEIAGLLDHGLDRQLWWLPWGEQVSFPSYFCDIFLIFFAFFSRSPVVERPVLMADVANRHEID